MKTAIVLGATGLVGRQLVQLLLHNYGYEQVKVFARRKTGLQHPKLREYIVDFDRPDEWQHSVQGDVLFSAFGTTLRKAGGKEAQYKIDYTYQYQMAEIACKNGVKNYVLVSAAGANASSRIFYSRIKGELERDVMRLPFNAITILRPGLLAGRRDDKRPAEEISYKILKFLTAIPGLDKYRPIYDVQVAKAMIHASLRENGGIYKYTLNEIFGLAAKQK